MAGLPQMRLGHVGLFVTDLEKMRDFYTRVLGFTVTDSGRGRSAEFVFMSRDPDEHHQIVLASGRPPESFGVINQISFRVDTLDELRAAHALLVDAEVEAIDPVDHGNTWSVYFNDPEGNRLEIYIATPWYVAQPHAERLDLSLSDDELMRVCEEKVQRDPTCRPVEEWRAELGRLLKAVG